MITRSTAARHLHRWIGGAGMALLLAAPPSAVAAPCAAFTDVEDSSAFCQNVEWLKNRQITLG